MKLGRFVVVAAVIVMLASAVTGLVIALIEREIGFHSLTALTVGLGALLIALAGLVVEKLNRRFHPESSLFLWSDVDNLRSVARHATDDETRDWALSLGERIAAVLPGREADFTAKSRSTRRTDSSPRSH
jgi:hypothetical protein